MGAKTWMLVYSDTSAKDALARHPKLDRALTLERTQALFPGEKLIPLEDGDLSFTSPPGNELFAGCFPGVSVFAASEFGLDHPSKLPKPFVEAGGIGSIVLHAMHSVVDWFAFAKWHSGELVRSLSLSPDSGILEDIGPRLPFEVPYWNGDHPAVDDSEEDYAYPFPFHPLELGEAALKDFFGYQIEGVIDRALLDPFTIPLLRYKRSRKWWKFWR